MKDQVKLNIDLKATTALKSPSGNSVFSEGVILRKISKFIAGTSEDAIVPIPIFYDPMTGEILIEALPKELIEEYQDANI